MGSMPYQNQPVKKKSGFVWFGVFFRVFVTTAVWQWNRGVWARKLFSFEKCDWCSESRCKKYLPLALREVSSLKLIIGLQLESLNHPEELKYERKILYKFTNQKKNPKILSKFILPMQIFTFDDSLFFWLDKFPSSTLLESFQFNILEIRVLLTCDTKSLQPFLLYFYWVFPVVLVNQGGVWNNPFFSFPCCSYFTPS